MSDDEVPADGAPAADDPTDANADPFAAEIDRARDLLDGEGIEAVHVGVVRDGEVDTAFAQRGDGDAENEGLRALALLAAHVRLVAGEAGVDASTVAGDAATLAGQVERIPASTDDLPEE
ncbi:hypothetical protein [Halorubrum amylolyticum]|uniref:hypothetical protein n=1 Tax=Halorubrum amylolyticum TaxID=2508724 RepID=UPI0010088BB8|nr:hypothetical protein [Halorubrum amylolyticum]